MRLLEMRRRKAGVNYIGVGVGGALFMEGAVLLAQRGPKAKNEQGTWEFPGGKVNFGELAPKAVEREFREEHGVTIVADPESALYADHIIPAVKRRRGEHWATVLYECRLVSGTLVIREPTKCSAIGWFTQEQAQGLEVSIVTGEDLRLLQKRYPSGFPN